eukprot:19770-Heterococcus_DN1.PRE.2
MLELLAEQCDIAGEVCVLVMPVAICSTVVDGATASYTIHRYCGCPNAPKDPSTTTTCINFPIAAKASYTYNGSLHYVHAGGTHTAVSGLCLSGHCYYKQLCIVKGLVSLIASTLPTFCPWFAQPEPACVERLRCILRRRSFACRLRHAEGGLTAA